MKFSKRMESLVPYAYGEQPRDRRYIKLNTNENPYPPCPGIISFLKNIDVSVIKLYPDPMAIELRKVIADYHSVSSENIFTGNGSDEILSFLFYAFFDPDCYVYYPDYTYSFYPVYSSFYQLKSKTIPLDNDFRLNLNDYLFDGRYGTIFPNPNAPTGIYTELDEIEKFLKLYSGDNPIVIDEAYIDFGGESCVPLITKYSNLLSVRTLSKSAGLAGLRVGYAVGNPELIKSLCIVKDSFNSYTVNVISQECARIAFLEWDYYLDKSRKIINIRDNFINFLDNNNWKVLPSKANFVFTSSPSFSGSEAYDKFRANGVLVRHFSKAGIENYLRISIGTEEDMNKVMDIIKKEF